MISVFIIFSNCQIFDLTMIRSEKFNDLYSGRAPIRRHEKQMLKKERLLRTKQLFKSLTKAKTDRGFLTHRSYLCFLLLLQIPLHHIVVLFDYVFSYGAVLVLTVYIMLMLSIGVALFMLFAFMGRYCRKGYFRYWQCVPLLKGAGYTIALMTITPEFINTSSAGLSLLYINDMFSREIPWVKCTFQHVTNTCLPMNQKRSPRPGGQTVVNCSEVKLSKIPTFSALNYLRFNKQNQYPYEYYSRLGPIKKDWAIAVTLTWTLIFLFMLHGFQSFQRVMTTLQFGSCICWAIVFIITLRHRGSYQEGDTLFHGMGTVKNVEFWWHLFMHVCDQNKPANLILLSSMVNSVTTPNIDAIIVYSIKIVIVVFLIVWVPILMPNVLGHYGITKSDCWTVSGFEVIFAVIPDVLSRIVFAQTWMIVWFVCIFIHSFSSTLYMFTGTIDSLIDAFPKLSSYRLHICAIICTSSISINLIFLTRLSTVLMYSWTEYGMVLLRMIVFALVTFALTFIYSIARLVNDYHFAYGEPPNNFWIQSWKVTPFLVLFATIFTFYRQRDARKIQHTTPTFILLSYIIAVLMLLPICGVMLWNYCKHVKYQMVSSIVRPEVGWGYYNALKILARKHFNPQREVRYKTNRVKCKHNCLANSKKMKRLQQSIDIRRHSLISRMNDEELESNGAPVTPEVSSIIYL